MSDERIIFSQTIVSSLVSGAVVAALVGTVLKYYFDSQLDEFRVQRAYELEEFRVQRAYDLAVLTELVGPAVMQFARRDAVSKRYSTGSNQFFGDAVILNDINSRMRELLLAKGHLMPPDLVEPSKCLIAHYDIWLRLFEARLAEYEAKHRRSPQQDTPFDVGFASLVENAGECGEFPDKVPGLYMDTMEVLQTRLFSASRT